MMGVAFTHLYIYSYLITSKLSDKCFFYVCFFFVCYENWRGPISLWAGVLCRNAEEEQQHEGAPDLVILYLRRRRLEDVERGLTAVICTCRSW